jgi:GAF domain-containing protein
VTDHQRSVFSAAAALLAVSLKNSELFREVRENSVRDALTGCFNRMHALEVLTLSFAVHAARACRCPS